MYLTVRGRFSARIVNAFFRVMILEVSMNLESMETETGIMSLLCRSIMRGLSAQTEKTARVKQMSVSAEAMRGENTMVTEKDTLRTICMEKSAQHLE